MGLSISHLLLVLAVVFILFGAGKLPSVMEDIGKGIRNFRQGLKEEEDVETKNNIRDHTTFSKDE